MLVKTEKHKTKRSAVKLAVMVLFVVIIAILGFLLFLKYQSTTSAKRASIGMAMVSDSSRSTHAIAGSSGNLELEYLGEVHIESYEGYFRVERLKNGFDEENFSFWYTYAPVTSDNPNDPLFSISEYNIDTETEMVVVAVNRKLDSLVVDEDSIYDGMMELDQSGNKIPQPPFLSATFAPNYYPNTLFLYRAPLIRFRSHYTASPDLYNEWNQIAK